MKTVDSASFGRHVKRLRGLWRVGKLRKIRQRRKVGGWIKEAGGSIETRSRRNFEEVIIIRIEG